MAGRIGYVSSHQLNVTKPKPVLFVCERERLAGRWICGLIRWVCGCVN
jgi:hypothetical protein